MKQVLHVKIGEVKTAKSPDVLKATLGSCVGIAFVWKKMDRFGLAHCLLPSSDQNEPLGAKFVSQAIPSLMSLMQMSKSDFSSVEVYLAGGGNMMEQLSKRNIHNVGIQNAETAKALLAKLGVKPRWTDLGGEDARQMIVDCESGEVTVRKFKKEES